MVKKSLKFFILLSFIGIYGQSYSQQRLDGIEFERIHQRTIKKYIAGQIEEGKYLFDDIHPSWTTGQDLSTFREKVMTFFLNWCRYRTGLLLNLNLLYFHKRIVKDFHHNMQKLLNLDSSRI